MLSIGHHVTNSAARIILNAGCPASSVTLFYKLGWMPFYKQSLKLTYVLFFILYQQQDFEDQKIRPH